METRSCRLDFFDPTSFRSLPFDFKTHSTNPDTQNRQLSSLPRRFPIVLTNQPWSFDLSPSQMSLTTMVANYPVCTELLARPSSIQHLSTKLHKLVYPKELFWLPGKFKPLISCQTEETTSQRSRVCLYLYVRSCLKHSKELLLDMQSPNCSKLYAYLMHCLVSHWLEPFKEALGKL